MLTYFHGLIIQIRCQQLGLATTELFVYFRRKCRCISTIIAAHILNYFQIGETVTGIYLLL